MTLSIPQAATAISSLVSLALLWGLLYFFWASYRVDRYRHDLFMLRAELFDLAREGQLMFTNPAYVQLRTTLNGFLRFADRLGFISLCMGAHTLRTVPGAKDRVADLEAAWQRALEPLDEPVRERLQTLRSRMHLVVLGQVLFSSPLLTMTLVPILIFWIAQHAGRMVLTKMGRAVYETGMSVAREHVFRPLDTLAFSTAHASEIERISARPLTFA